VRALRSHPSFLEEMNAAADLTPDAIVTGRDAYRDGRLKSAEPIIDREYFAGLLGCSPRDPRLDGLTSNPSIAPVPSLQWRMCSCTCGSRTALRHGPGTPPIFNTH
jgi:hypothetical protein